MALPNACAEGAPERQHLAHALHVGGQLGGGARDLLEGEARQLDRDVVERRLEARRRDPGDLVGQLVERVPHRQARRDLGDREAGGLRGQRRAARHARVHLDDDHLARRAVQGELDVGAAGGDAHRADDGQGRVAQRLQLGVGQGHHRARPWPSRRCGPPSGRCSRSSRRPPRCRRRRASPRARSRPSRAPSARRAPGRSGSASSARARRSSSSAGVRAAPPPSPPSVKPGRRITGRPSSAAAARPAAMSPTTRLAGTARPAAAIVRRKASRSSARRIASASAPISSTPYRSRTACRRELHREVQGGLAAERGQQRVGALEGDDRLDGLEVERLDVGAVGHRGVGHDRGRVRVDQHHPVALGAQRAAGLGARVVELARLADHDRAAAEDQHGARCRRGAALADAPRRTRGTCSGRRAARGSPRGGTAPTTRAAPGAAMPSTEPSKRLVRVTSTPSGRPSASTA